jgi:phosphoribosylformylglycinamidine synthase
VDIDCDYIEHTFKEYLFLRSQLGIKKPITLMDIATIGAKTISPKDLDESEEINACSVKIKVDENGREKDWLLMFKNETHNHPTEIEPFGGAATCLGGAIRDPLSGRSYVYGAMRVTGASNPLTPVKDTIKGKLPQRIIVQKSANGYSSYGNQIGLATGQVTEYYHSGYAAKRLEIGAVIGAAPINNVVREKPIPGDVVILLGGRTGRDGIGGATGSSKSHNVSSLEKCGAEVQKGNPPEERKIQRLFRNNKVTRMIRRCNDFGAGGVSVAIGELTDGLVIDLDKVPKKYEGLDGTEIAISESQERMAVVVSDHDSKRFIYEAEQENLEATIVAKVLKEPRLRMFWNDNPVVNLSREFLNSNGAEKHTTVTIPNYPTTIRDMQFEDTADGWFDLVGNLNICCQKGLSERFDSTIGAGTVLMPFGGKNQLTPIQAMAHKIPVERGETTTCSLMAHGFNPIFSEKNPYLGGMFAVLESVARVVATGGDYRKCWLTFQEYFERTKNSPLRWGKPMSALLGALKAQLALGIASIGGKDSMSGSFEELDVPPTLVSFAVSVSNTGNIVSPEFKKAKNSVIYIAPKYEENGLPEWNSIKETFDTVQELITSGRAISVWAVGMGGIAEGVAKMCFGNGFGFKFVQTVSKKKLFEPFYGSFIVEVGDKHRDDEVLLGFVREEPVIRTVNYSVSLTDLSKKWMSKLEPVYPFRTEQNEDDNEATRFGFVSRAIPKAAVRFARPRVLIPVFPGTNCEYDSAKAFERAGAEVETFVIKNLSAYLLEDSIIEFKKSIDAAQIIMLPGGFSGGDEPDGSAKFIVSFFRNPHIREAVRELLKHRDGLMLGICNGFQALVKLGLVPYGDIVDTAVNAPTLTFNTISRHQSLMVRTVVSSNKSPWLSSSNVGDIHTVPISHGEGRFIADDEMLDFMKHHGQIATQYIDFYDKPTYDIRYNPNNSVQAIEGITSPDGKIFGKMGHSERHGDAICKNITGEKNQRIFENGVKYFS